MERDFGADVGERFGDAFSFSDLEREIKGRALPWLGFQPDLASVPLDDLFAKGEADAGPRVFFSGVQALKEEKDAFEIFWRNPDPIVRNRELPLRALALGANVDFGWVLATKLNGIANQVLKKLRELHGVALNSGQ